MNLPPIPPPHRRTYSTYDLASTACWFIRLAMSDASDFQSIVDVLRCISSACCCISISSCTSDSCCCTAPMALRPYWTSEQKSGYRVATSFLRTSQCKPLAKASANAESRPPISDADKRPSIDKFGSILGTPACTALKKWFVWPQLKEPYLIFDLGMGAKPGFL